MKNVILVSLFLSQAVFAGDHKHESLHAHEHGGVKLEVAVDKNQVSIHLDTPAESLIGFEYEAKTDKEKKIWADLQKTWSAGTKYFSIEASAGCSLKKAEIKREVTAGEAAGHSDLEGTASWDCKNSLAGKKIKVFLKKEFKNIKDLDADVIPSSGKPYSKELAGKVEELSL